MLASEKDIVDFTQDSENLPWNSQRGGASTNLPKADICRLARILFMMRHVFWQGRPGRRAGVGNVPQQMTWNSSWHAHWVEEPQ